MKIRIALSIAAALALNGCGFVTAPLGEGAAYLGKGAVKGTDKGIEYTGKGIEYGKEAAIIVAETAKDVGAAAIEGLKPASGDSHKGTLRPR